MANVYRNKFFVLSIAMLIALGLTLPACASEEPAPVSPAEEPAADEPAVSELSFEAAEYTNADYGLSVKYPTEWAEHPDKAAGCETVVFWAEGPTLIPVITLDVVDVEHGATLAEAETYSLELCGNELVEFLSKGETTLADGTPASEGVVKFISEGTPCKAYVVGTKRGDKWVMITQTTAYTYLPWEDVEDLFKEVAATIQFE